MKVTIVKALHNDPNPKPEPGVLVEFSYPPPETDFTDKHGKKLLEPHNLIIIRKSRKRK